MFPIVAHVCLLQEFLFQSFRIFGVKRASRETAPQERVVPIPVPAFCGTNPRNEVRIGAFFGKFRRIKTFNTPLNYNCPRGQDFSRLRSKPRLSA